MVFHLSSSTDIDWPAPGEISDVAIDFIKRLLVLDPQQRLGANGVQEVKQHEFFANVDWNTVYTLPMVDIFVPHLSSGMDTTYFGKLLYLLCKLH